MENIQVGVILLERIKTRVENVEKLKNQIPKLKIFNAIDWKKDWILIRRFFIKNKIPIKKLRLNTRGKYARWVSVILACKYIMENNIEMILLEDDVSISSPELFNESDLWYKKGNFVKLSNWGEAYYINKAGAQKFFDKIFSVGINDHNDVFIKKHVSEFEHKLITKRNLICPTNKGNIKNSRRCQFSNKNLKKDKNKNVLFNNRVSNIIFQKFISTKNIINCSD